MTCIRLIITGFLSLSFSHQATSFSSFLNLPDFYSICFLPLSLHLDISLSCFQSPPSRSWCAWYSGGVAVWLVKLISKCKLQKSCPFMQDASPLGCFIVGRKDLVFLEPRTIFSSLYVSEVTRLMSIAATHWSQNVGPLIHCLTWYITA
jgi:hypothetical protein